MDMNISSSQKPAQRGADKKAEEAQRKADANRAKQLAYQAEIKRIDEGLRLSCIAYKNAETAKPYLESHGYSHYLRVRRWFGAEGFCCIKGRRAYLSFAGTDSLFDVIIDVLGLIPWYKPRVHIGFGVSWRALKNKAILKWMHKHNDAFDDISLYGHSLGGAMAHVAALELALKHNIAEVITFGAPRSSWGSTAEQYDKTVPINSQRTLKELSTRVIHGFDIVSKVPFRWMGYRHVGHTVYLSYIGGKHIHVGKKAVLTQSNETIFTLIAHITSHLFTFKRKPKSVQKFNSSQTIGKKDLWDMAMATPPLREIVLVSLVLLAIIPAFLTMVFLIVVSLFSHPSKQYLNYFSCRDMTNELKKPKPKGLLGKMSTLCSTLATWLKKVLALLFIASLIYASYLLFLHIVLPGFASIPSWFEK